MAYLVTSLIGAQLPKRESGRAARFAAFAAASACVRLLPGLGPEPDIEQPWQRQGDIGMQTGF